ncbi:MAG: serine/threonine-protein kinase [bacterium]
MENRIIGNYRVLDKIGSGGMANVYLAVHRDIPSLHVVLKMLGDPKLVERFKREADKLACLDGHPGICQIKNFFDHEGVFYIAMEYIDGRTIQELIDDEGPLDLGRALYLSRTILDILEAAHARGICHRDIKPTNIMIDRNDHLKIIDFGLAKAESDPRLTSVGTSLGSPLFMAPEQFNPSPEQDFIPCDIYAVGITLYFMLTGMLPFGGENILQILDSKTKLPIRRPGTYNSDIPPAVEATIMKCLAVDPRRRFPSAAAMKMALVSGPEGMETWLGDRAATAAAPGAATVALDLNEVAGGGEARPAGSSPGRKGLPRWIAPVALVAVLALAFGLKPLLFGPGGTADEPLVMQQADAVGQDQAAALTETDPGVIAAREDAPLQAETTGNVEFQPAADKESPLERDPVRDDPPAPVPARGELVIGSLPAFGARIWVDGVDTKRETPYTLSLPEGDHVIKVVMSSGGTTSELQETVTVVADQSQKKIFRFQ